MPSIFYPWRGKESRLKKEAASFWTLSNGMQKFWGSFVLPYFNALLDIKWGGGGYKFWSSSPILWLLFGKYIGGKHNFNRNMVFKAILDIKCGGAEVHLTLQEQSLQQAGGPSLHRGRCAGSPHGGRTRLHSKTRTLEFAHSSKILCTRRYSPLRGLTSRSCGGLRPRIFCPLGKNIVLYAVLAYFTPCLLFSSNFSNF